MKKEYLGGRIVAYHGDCLDIMPTLEKVDLVLTDPPYLIENTRAGGKSNLAKSIQVMNAEIKNANLTCGISTDFIDLVKQDNINFYIWCNHKQIPQYLDKFVKQKKCSFDILVWNKINAMPLFNNKYLTDKEYCLYFRKNAYCNPSNYNDAKTIFNIPINIKDKNKWGHPTIKPISIIQTLIRNSSKSNDLILDVFGGSGTTAIACIKENRRCIIIEKDKEYFDIMCKRIEDAIIEKESEFKF